MESHPVSDEHYLTVPHSCILETEVQRVEYVYLSSLACQRESWDPSSVRALAGCGQFPTCLRVPPPLRRKSSEGISYCSKLRESRVPSSCVNMLDVCSLQLLEGPLCCALQGLRGALTVSLLKATPLRFAQMSTLRALPQLWAPPLPTRLYRGSMPGLPRAGMGKDSEASLQNGPHGPVQSCSIPPTNFL